MRAWAWNVQLLVLEQERLFRVNFTSEQQKLHMVSSLSTKFVHVLFELLRDASRYCISLSGILYRLQGVFIPRAPEAGREQRYFEICPRTTIFRFGASVPTELPNLKVVWVYLEKIQGEKTVTRLPGSFLRIISGNITTEIPRMVSGIGRHRSDRSQNFFVPVRFPS